MLVLFETAAGFAVFKLLDEKKLHQTDNLYADFQTPERASKIIKLKQFAKFADTTEALASATAMIEGKMSKTLKKLLKKLVDSDMHEELAVADAKLGNCIKEKLNLACVSNSSVQELMRCIRSQIDSLVTGIDKKDFSAMALGLAHSLSRYKLKFSPDKVDTMIVQAVSLLDDLDKELNNYIMRCKEWYGWHFPELGKIILDNVAYIKTVKAIGTRDNASTTDLSSILSEELENEVKETAEISMGTEIAEEDILNIHFLCDQVLEMNLYRAELYEYLKNRMMAIAPNLTILVGELIGARLISHAGSLISLAKHPASTVQILGAEKALFRALKTRHDTPKYGLIYHAQLVGQCSAKLKGKMSRMLAAKTSLACRLDALGEESTVALGTEHRARLEARLKQLEDGSARRISGLGKSQSKFKKHVFSSEDNQEYLSAADSTLPLKRKLETEDGVPAKKVKVAVDEDFDITVESAKKKKKKKDMNQETEEEQLDTPQKKKKKKSITVEEDTEILEETSSSKKKKKSKQFEEESEQSSSASKKKKSIVTEEVDTEAPEENVSAKKKKKKKHKVQLEDD